MPRHEAKPLSPETAARQDLAVERLRPRIGQVVTLTYVKRNGTLSESTGAVQYFNGCPGFDTGAVTLDTTETKGRPSSVNLHNILTIDGQRL